jgi:SNF2 family DNA or RNA helicase
MGLGKTVIGIAAAESLLDSGDITCCLVVCPPSLKYQWAEKIAEFTDLPVVAKEMRDAEIVIPDISGCIVIDGTKKQRLDQFAMAKTMKPHYIVLGYENVINDYTQVTAIKPGMVVLDEATAIKSFKAQRSKRIKKALRPHYRLALTGTPIENRPDEVFSIMQWVDETCLGRYDLFDKAYIKRNKYGWPVAYKNLPVLKARLAPAISRKSRADADVKPFLPKVVESEWVVPTDVATMHLYKKIATDMVGELDEISPYTDFEIHDYYNGVDESQPNGKLMAMYMCMEMLLDHPDLIIHSAQLYDSEAFGGSRYAYTLWQSGALDDITSTPKLDFLLEKLIPILEFEGNKILIFSQYKFMLTLIQEQLTCGSVQFHGSMSPAMKAEAVAKFANDPDCRVFLSSHAGAYGMDMKMANHLINYDLPWSSGKWDQINHRHIRASSEFDKVMLVHMFVDNSIESRKLRILRRKKRIAGAILDGDGQDDLGQVVVEGDSLKANLSLVVSGRNLSA